MKLPAAGPPTSVIGGATVLIGLAVMLTLNAHRMTRSDAPPASESTRRITSLQLDKDQEFGGVHRFGRGVASSLAEPGTAGGSMMRLPAFAGPRYIVRAVGSQPLASQPQRPAFDPRTLDRLNRGGYSPGDRAHYVGGPGDRAGPAGDLALVGVGDIDADGGGSGTSASGGSGIDGAVRASMVRNQSYTVAAGEIIRATLETPIDTAQPGMIRAIVSQNVRSLDGRLVLIPRGSRLIGEARANQQAGQHRVLVLWSRLIRPDGAAVRIDSQAGDPLGGAGIPGSSGSRFFARFANAVLQTAMTVGANLANRGSTTIVLGGAGSAGVQLAGGIIPGADLPPTVKVRSGASVSAFVARDLDFSGVPRP